MRGVAVARKIEWRLITWSLGIVIMRRKRRKRGAFSCAASRTNWRTVSSVTCAHTVRLSLKHALMHL